MVKVSLADKKLLKAAVEINFGLSQELDEKNKRINSPVPFRGGDRFNKRGRELSRLRRDIQKRFENLARVGSEELVALARKAKGPKVKKKIILMAMVWAEGTTAKEAIRINDECSEDESEDFFASSGELGKSNLSMAVGATV